MSLFFSYRMIQRFSSHSKVFSAKQYENGCEFTWQTSIDLSTYKYMAVHDFYATSWPSDGKKLSHLSSNLTDPSICNPNGHIYTWFKKPIPRLDGLTKNILATHNILFKNSICLTETLPTK